jgi:excisionase family DNA binding protein
MTYAENLAYFTDVLKCLDALRDRALKDSVLSKLVAEASEPIGSLVGYFIPEREEGRIISQAEAKADPAIKDHDAALKADPAGQLGYFPDHLASQAARSRRASARSRRSYEENSQRSSQCLTVSADMVYDLFQRGDLPGWKVGSTWLLTKAAVLRWLEASTGVDHPEYGSRAGRRARPRPCPLSAWRAGEMAMGISSP